MKTYGKGFTLIELLVVISIILVLSSIILVSLSSARENARTTGALIFASSLEHSKGLDAIGIWDLNEGSGNSIIDKSAYNHNGTILGNLTWSTDTANPNKNYSVFFPGIYGNCIDITNSGTTPINQKFLINKNNGFTVMAWIKPSSTYGYIYTKVAAPRFWISGGKINIQLYKTGSVVLVTLEGNSVLTMNKWYHVAGIYDNGKLIIYVDGRVDGEVDVSGYTDDIYNWTGNYSARIGCYYEGGAPFKGYIDEVRFFNGAPSIAEIQKIFAEGRSKHIN